VTFVGSCLAQEEDKNKALHHHGGSIGVDFSLLLNASYLIIPNSSFSWWAAYLNTKRKAVVAPKYWAAYNVSDGYWSTSDIITDDFTYLDRQGKVTLPQECWKEKEAYESAHPDMFVECEMEKRQIPSYGKIVVIEFRKRARKIKFAIRKILKRNKRNNHMKVTIFTIANIRPDFIEIQYDTIKKFLKDTDFEYIIFNTPTTTRSAFNSSRIFVEN